MHTSWRRSLIAAALFAGCGAVALSDQMPAMAADSGGAPPAGAAVPSSPGAVLQPFNSQAEDADIGNHRAVPPAMLAALEDLSKKSIAESQPISRPSQTGKEPAGAGIQPGKTNQAVTAGRAQQRKSTPEPQTAHRGRRPSGPASKIEALRERLQQGPAALRRRGFRRAA